MPGFVSRLVARRRLRPRGAFLLGASLALPRIAVAEIRVGVSDWPGWVAWYVAEQKGFFKQHGAEVKVVWFANYTDSIAGTAIDANEKEAA